MMEMKQEKIRAWVEIDTEAFIHNLRLAKKQTGKKVMAVIKGNAHGHGAVVCGLLLEANGADAFAVACFTEGVALRQGGIRAPILILGWTPAEFAPRLAAYNLTQSVIDEEYAVELNNAASLSGKTVDVHIKLDTGMSRTGIFAQENPADAARAVDRIAKLSNLHVKGIFTHFAAADMPEKDDFTAWQLNNYKAVLQELDALGFDQDVILHTGNSASILCHKETYFDMVRMGVMMYGLYPNGVFSAEGPLEQALTLKARVAQVKELPAGASISYGCTYQTEHPARIAVVTAGYADAYPRSMSNKGAYAVINGQRCPQVGRICMDMVMFDVTNADVRRGDEAILYGKGGMPMEEVANLAGSINCEPLCLLTNRVEKIYI